MRYDVHMCNFDLYECGSIYICLFQCIYMRFDVYMLNFVVYVYSLIILSITERHKGVHCHEPAKSRVPIET